MNYPDYMSRSQMCFVEGHLGKGNCSRCGDINYHLLGYYGAVARWAKAWNITELEAEQRINLNYIRKHP